MKASRKDVERRTYRLKLSEVEMIHLHGLVRDHVPTSRLNSRIYSVLEAALAPPVVFADAFDNELAWVARQEAFNGPMGRFK